MRYLLLAALLLAAPLGALALTWDFDEGTTWGWTAQESWLGNNLGGATPTTVYSEVEDGIWRIAPVPGATRPTIRLISPLIGEDSALFDWVTLRLRIIHDRPTGGNLFMYWSNVGSRRRKQEADYAALPDRSGFYTIRSQLYPIEWENITIDIRDLEAEPGAEITWQDTLFHLQLELVLNRAPKGPADHPAFVEVDWIQLTGAEELLLGELQPRALAVEAELPRALFAEPRFSVLGQNIGEGILKNTLGDVDGDGDADLVVLAPGGWTIAASDGWGGLVPSGQVLRPSQDGFAPIREIAGGDLDGDGLLDLVFSLADRDGRTTVLRLNRGEDGFATILQLPDSYLIGLADGDGDGDVDLVVLDLDDLSANVIMWINDGAGGFAHSDRFFLDTEEDLRAFPLPLAGQPVGEAVYLLWNRGCFESVGPWRLTQPWAARPPPPLFFDAEVNPCHLNLLADLNGDGAVELVGTPELNLFFDFDALPTYHGLALWRVDPSGGVERHTLLGPQVLVPDPHFYEGVLTRDLTGDGLLDLAVVDVNVATGPALVVLVGQRDGVPVVEGRYRLPGIGKEVLAGDVNGDGAIDLVVLGRSMEGNGGAFVFLNQGIPAATAIAAETATMPTAFALGANYPNPFNPATTIPVVVPAEAGDVDLTIYNVLGQPVRQVWAGPLTAGEHRLAWDGRDGQGQPVAAGVYVVRLHQGDQTRIRKMVKLE